MGNYVVLQQQKRTVNRLLWFGETETELKMTVWWQKNVALFVSIHWQSSSICLVTLAHSMRLIHPRCRTKSVDSVQLCAFHFTN